MLYGVRGFWSAKASGTVSWAGILLASWRRALKHKYIVGETVYFTASNVARPAASGTYEVIKLLPTDGDDCQYRIKSSTEAFERVAKESQLDVS
jgi:predicted RNA-binding protein with PUA-like domain